MAGSAGRNALQFAKGHGPGILKGLRVKGVLKPVLHVSVGQGVAGSHLLAGQKVAVHPDHRLGPQVPQLSSPH